MRTRHPVFLQHAKRSACTFWCLSWSMHMPAEIKRVQASHITSVGACWCQLSYLRHPTSCFPTALSLAHLSKSVICCVRYSSFSCEMMRAPSYTAKHRTLPQRLNTLKTQDCMGLRSCPLPLVSTVSGEGATSAAAKAPVGLHPRTTAVDATATRAFCAMLPMLCDCLGSASHLMGRLLAWNARVLPCNNPDDGWLCNCSCCAIYPELGITGLSWFTLVKQP
jgi:hypothetical protein